MSDMPASVVDQIDTLKRELQELTDARWDRSPSKSGAKQLKGIATRIVLSAKYLESLVNIPTELIQFKIDTSGREKALIEARKNELEAEVALLKAAKEAEQAKTEQEQTQATADAP